MRDGSTLLTCACIGAMVTLTVQGCKEALQRTEDIALLEEAARHQLELNECVAKGKAAKSYAVYTACADYVDQRFGIAVTDAGLR